jgi:oxygen-independent coproporphyrinogen-3 oxidase
MVKEAADEKGYLQGQSIETIYFGGGTPSLLQVEDITLLLETIRNNYSIYSNAEVTLEANPDDITGEKLKQWKEAGINRLSIGIQSFFEEELKWMNRAHSSIQASRCIELALHEGFNNFSIDLIYGSPLLTDEMWKQNVEKALEYGIPHLSCYALTVEEKTPLHKLIAQNSKQSVDADKQARQFLLLMNWLHQKGYEHYEVSNFAKPGFRSRHNSSYWQGKNYLGIGPSAHSFNGNERRWNINNNQIYSKGLMEGIPVREQELLTQAQRLNEYIMISLRTCEGIDLNKIGLNWGETEKERIALQIKKYLEHQLISISDSHIRLTNEGMLMADGIASDLFTTGI